MKYRRLNSQELEMLESRFIQFLAANTVTGPDWERIKKEDPEKTEGLIEIFSDLVFEETLEKVEYLQHRTATELRCFHCESELITMMGMIAKDTVGFDFRNNNDPKDMMAAVKSSGGTIQFFSAEKKYKGDRKQELFRMMEHGCLISKGEIFKALKQVAPN